ncbi:hypothetical protein nbrc107696_43880 [Gordonia spumicola]|uniref:Uncharacterized protein n=1 Tax=Gordonia spumicola TaxID=589161 RepID=A0A7I9VFF8_9ACTN|nr:hypothetical protein nbrc107696_43880 [Gordonia spumicola]
MCDIFVHTPSGPGGRGFDPAAALSLRALLNQHEGSNAETNGDWLKPCTTQAGRGGVDMV